ncbi:MAG TPA: serine/threonine-protein kinase [Polyangia bacterium]|nr:serine/threonine-protein kinase [Polyangia bacterium]
MKRALAVLLAVGLLAAAYAVSRTIEAGRARTVRLEASRSAEAGGMRAADALAAHVGELKLEAQNAAQNPRLVAALRGNADAATLQDLFRTEQWWEPYRNTFKVYAVAFEGDKLDVIEGMENADFASDLLIREARERHEAVAEIVMGKGWPYAAAAALVDLPGKSVPAVLLLARPIEEGAIRKLAEKARGAVLLSDGAKAVLEAGPEPERESLRAAVGAEKRGPIFQAQEASGPIWAAAVSSVVPGLWLWTYGAGVAHDADNAAVVTSAIVWSLAGILAIITLALGLRRREPAGTTSTGSGAVSFAGGGADTVRASDPARPVPSTRPGLGQPGGADAPGSTGRTVGHAATETYDTGSTQPRIGGGVRFGRYQLIDLLGEGGMAQVYTAVTFGAEGFRRAFVVKRLRAELSRDPAVVAQFIDEANLGSSLVHSNVIPVFDFGKVGDEYYLAQEYIVGRDLGRVTMRSLERLHHPTSPAIVLYVASETLQALEYAHSKLGDGGRSMGIVHRDVSPSNILISARGEVKLFDFGIVKAEGRVTKTQHGVVKGNVSFMSPEQARGTDVDGRADLFSLGLVIFYCLTGSVLYQGDTTYELLVKAATGPGPAELARIAALPPPCNTLLAKALAVDPAQRFQTAADFAAALAPHVTGGASAAASLMRALFGDDFRAEEARFAAAIPASDSNPRSQGGGGSEWQNRRS